MKRYWDRIETPFGLFAAWVDEAGKLLRFRFRRDDAERVDREAEQNPRRWRMSAVRWRNIPPASARFLNSTCNAEGPDFDKLVWKALSDIPFGASPPMARVAKAIGQPGAAEQSAPPMAPIPLLSIVPCHRVIGSDGSLTGFGGGLPLKRRLLEHEARVCGTRYDLFG